MTKGLIITAFAFIVGLAYVGITTTTASAQTATPTTEAMMSPTPAAMVPDGAPATGRGN